jgi:biotin-dependent carboxylase-like uncharacterized protein
LIHIIDPGPLTTVQDLGRFGHLRSGIPPAGPMDRDAFILANRLVGNDDNAAALECTLLGPRFRVDSACAIAVTGADMPLSVNDTSAPRWATRRLAAGDIVRLGAAKHAVRAYIAFSGGLDVPLALGSRATYVRGNLGGHEGRALRAGDTVRMFVANRRSLLRVSDADIPEYLGEVTAHVILGPQHDRFTHRGIATLLQSEYRIAPQSDRMGLRLEGPTIEHRDGHDIVSDGIALGSIQVPGNGQPIVLMVDRQSTGGYTKIATVCSFDIGRLGQLRPGQVVRFRSISVEQAHRRLQLEDTWLNELELEET